MKLNSVLISTCLAVALVLSGCSSSIMANRVTPEVEIKRIGFSFKLPNFSFKRTGSAKFLRDYRAVKDAGYTIPEIPVEKIDKQYLRQRVDYAGSEKPGTIIVDVSKRFLYLIEEGGKAIRYGVGVGKAGFEWQGNAYVGWKREWPKWTPPNEMIKRKPELVKYSQDNGGMPPGLNNPLGARALYLFKNGKDTLYRLHGTPEWWTIGTAASSGCIRLMNQDILDLYSRVNARAKVVVKQ